MRRIQCIVYGLYDAEGHLRYIGQTKLRELGRRLKWHRRQVSIKRANHRRLTPVQAWVEKTTELTIRPLEGKAVWNLTERQYIIEARRLGFKLLNVI